MEKRCHFSQSLLSLLCTLSFYSVSVVALSRDKLPPGFIFGAGASAYHGPLRKVTGGEQTTPWALIKLMDHIKVYYGNPPVMIHGNGYAEAVDPANPDIIYDDAFRTNFIMQYLEALNLSIRNGSNAQGYFVWSFIDTFEFLYGYTFRYGLYGVDFTSEAKPRYQRLSAQWYAKILGGNGLWKNTSQKDVVYHE